MAVVHARTFGELLKYFRQMKGLSQEELAERAGLSARGISDLEREARRAPWPSTLRQLADGLGLTDEERAALFAAAGGLPIPPLPDGQQAGSVDGAAQSANRRGQRSGHLPSPLTTFVGRSRELDQLQRLLATPESRLLTIVGPGGIGKTRLATEAAHRNSASFAHGARLVRLALAPSADMLPFAISDVLDFSFAGTAAPVTQLATHLRDKTLLLVLDNFEHLVDGAPLLAELLAGAPHVKALVTSRERLNLQGEWVLSIGGVDYPSALGDDDFERSSAVQLFMQRAQRVQPAFSLHDEATDVLRICQLVAGMPLALELAAAWVRLMPCSQIAQQLAASLDFLAAPLRDVPERRRSLRAVFDYSWNFLSPAEQWTLAKLSVLRGAFDLEAAEEVGGVSLPLLASLADKSLLQADGRGGYSLHELLRRYASDHLTDQTDVANHRERAIDYLTRAAESASQAGAQRKAAGLLGQAIAIAEDAGGPVLLGELRFKRGQALSQVGLWVEARPDFVAALAAARADSPDNIDQLVQILLELSEMDFYRYDVASQRQHVLEAVALAEAAQRGDLVDAAMVEQGAVESNDGNLEEAVRVYERVIEQGGDAHFDLGLTLYWLGRYPDALTHLRRADAAQANAVDQIFPLQTLGLALAATGQYREAVQVVEQARRLSQEHEVWPMLARSVSVMAGIYLDVFDYAGSETLAEEARTLARSADFVLAEVSAGLDLLFNFARRKEVVRAAHLVDEVAEAVEKARGSHAWLWRLRFAQARAELALARRDWDEALRLANSALQQSRSVGRVKYEVLALQTHAQALALVGGMTEAKVELRTALDAARPTGDPALFFRVAAASLAIERDNALAQEAYATAQRIRAELPNEEMQRIFDAAEPVRQVARLIG